MADKLPVKCFDDNCLIVLTDQAISINHKTVTFVSTVAQTFLPEGHVFEVKNHTYHSNWCIGAKFLYEVNGVISFPIVAKKQDIIKPGMAICHLQIVNVQEVFHRLKEETDADYYFSTEDETEERVQHIERPAKDPLICEPHICKKDKNV